MDHAPHRVYLLSPASCGGERARILLRSEATFELARRLRSREGAPLGGVFSFLSGLYFRGKLTYASRFAVPPPGVRGVLVITAGDGLRPADERVRSSRLCRWAGIPVDADEVRYSAPLLRDAEVLARSLGPDCEVVLLGSLATAKYLAPLARALGDRLRVPRDFVGRGDMSRGGLLLRAAADGIPLAYAKPDDIPRRGARPSKLVPRPGLAGLGALPRGPAVRVAGVEDRIAAEGGPAAGGPTANAQRRQGSLRETFSARAARRGASSRSPSRRRRA